MSYTTPACFSTFFDLRTQYSPYSTVVENS